MNACSCLLEISTQPWLCHRDQLYGQWSYEDFRENHLAAFMEMVKEYASSADFPHEEAEIDA